MAQVTIHGGEKRSAFGIVRPLRENTHCSIRDVLNYSEMVAQGQTVVIDGISVVDARRIEEQLRTLTFRVSVSE